MLEVHVNVSAHRVQRKHTIRTCTQWHLNLPRICMRREAPLRYNYRVTYQDNTVTYNASYPYGDEVDR